MSSMKTLHFSCINTLHSLLDKISFGYSSGLVEKLHSTTQLSVMMNLKSNFSPYFFLREKLYLLGVIYSHHSNYFVAYCQLILHFGP